MALVKIPPPPAPQQSVDNGESNKGVFYSWHEWFTRLWGFVNDLYDLVISIQNGTVVTDSGMVPYYIPVDESFTVPIYKQALFAHSIVMDGPLYVDGMLIQVD